MARTAGSHAEITGPRLRQAALRLFASQGYAAVSMRRIAQEVGVQVGALYNYTPDKQSLLFGLMRDHLQELLAAWEAQPVSDNPLEALETFTRFHIRHHLERRESVFIAYMELRNLTPENFAEIEMLRGAYESRLQAVLKAGVEAGVLHVPDVKLAAMAIIAMLNGVGTWYRDDGRLSLQDVERIHWDMVRGAVGSGGRTTPHRLV